MKNCKNCFFWKQKSDEKTMGYCFKSTKNPKEIKLTEKKSLNCGIAIRYENKKPDKVEVLMGENFGCIHFEKQ